MPDNDTFAALDLGSNSFHLMVASFDSGRLRVIDRHKDMVRLADGLDSKGRLSEDAIQRGLGSLAKMAERLSGIPEDHIRIVGTNTLRAAKNAKAFIQPAEKLLGQTINIISGTEEARLIYLGIATDFTPGNKRRLIVDIGGGSTELVIGRNRPRVLESLRMGCVSYSKRFFENGKISPKAFKRACNAAAQNLEPIAGKFPAEAWDEAVGASGTIRSIQKMLDANGLSDDQYIQHKALKELRDRFLKFDTIDSIRMPGLADERKPVIIGGLAVLMAVFEALEIKQLQVSDRAIREGIVHDLSGRLAHRDMRESTIRYISRQYHLDVAQGRRVAALAKRWLPEIAEQLITPREEVLRLLDWAGRLHEIGLAIAHSGYHKHSAYVLSNADLPGFSRDEQSKLGFLALNHRRKLREPMDAEPPENRDWMLVALFRLSCLLHRRRQEIAIPAAIQLRSDRPGKLCLDVPAEWLDEHPLTAEALEEEAVVLAERDITLMIRSR